MYKTDFIVRYRDIENELTKRYEHRIADEISSEISKAIQSSFNFTDINIVTNVNGTPISNTTVSTPKEQTQAVENQHVDKSEEDDSDDEEDYKYTREDITYICDKLYRDELLSVFDADSLEDPKMDAGIKMVFEHLIKHDEFIDFLKELSPKVMDKSNVKTEQEQFNFKRNTDYLIFITMFSNPVFYLTHQCICKMLVNAHVGDELIGELKDKLLQIFSHC